MTPAAGRAPRDWLVAGSWPDGEFAPEAPAWLAWVVELSRRLRYQQWRLGVDSPALAPGAPRLHRRELAHLRAAMDGRVVPDLVVVAAAEMQWQLPLWPRQPPPPLRRRVHPPGRA